MNQEHPIPDDAPAHAADDVIESLVADATDEFMDRALKGEDPNIEEHARRYPQISGILRELLPAVRLMQQTEPAAGEPLGLLGDFRLVRQIGRGGMGVVYEAEQISLRRRVALKVLPLAAALDPRQLERFRLEAQAAAHLHHSNIVPIYSVGCERGVYYYAMQFIEGRSLAEVIAHGVAGHGVVARQAPATDDPAAGAAAGSSSRGTVEPSANETKSDALARTQTTEILQGEKHFQRIATLGIQAADALEHAHSMGVIHRDIKPANLLLDMRGTLYVADFGLARLQGDVGLTQSGGLAGTLRYMSPEQVLGQRGIVDHRTDIYSLGVTLYELLALVPAFDAADRPALLQQIVHDEPLPLRQRNKNIPVDLETIILKAMAKEPAARYANGQHMAEDLRRFLDHRPILARRPTLWESTAKWTRRHRAVAVAALVVVVLCAIGFAISTALVMRAYNDLTLAQKKTQAAYLAESKQRSKAERSMQQAREVVDFMTQVSEEELGDKPELTGVRRMLLASALDYYQEFIKHSQDDPSLRAQLVASHVRVAAILDEIGSKPEALAALQQARNLQEKLLHADPMMPELQRGFFSIYSRLDLLRGGRDLNLLQQRSVQDDLGLSKAQISEVDTLMHERRDRLADTQRLTAEQWRLKFEQLEQQQRRVAELLQPKQDARLAQIALQQRGSEAFTDPEIAAALKLTQQQIQQIRTLREESRQNVWSMVRPGDMRGEQWKKARDLARKTNDSILAVLTPEQSQKWNDLTGAKFEGKLMSHRGGWRGWPRERAGGQRDLPLPIPLDETKPEEP